MTAIEPSEHPSERPFEEVIVEIRGAKVEITKLPAGVVGFICNHDDAEEIESMGETYSVKTVRGPVDRSTLGLQLLKEKLHEKLREIDAVREGMTALIDYLPMKDAEDLAQAFSSIKDAQREIMDAINEVLQEHGAPEDPRKFHGPAAGPENGEASR